MNDELRNAWTVYIQHGDKPPNHLATIVTDEVFVSEESLLEWYANEYGFDIANLSISHKHHCVVYKETRKGMKK